MSRTRDEVEELDDLGRRARLLREPARPMPPSLRGRLLAIPTEAESHSTGYDTGDGRGDDTGDATEIDRLYGAALSAALTATPSVAPSAAPSPETQADLDPDDLRTTPLRAAVVRLLAAVFRDARAARPVPERLSEGLRAVRHKARPAWRTRWITEPRWAAAACWLLAFALTLGTGDAVAGLLDAPAKLRQTSTSWAIPWIADWTESTEAQLEDAWTATRDGLADGYDLLHSRAVALGVQAEAWAVRALGDLESGWIYLTQTFAPTYETNPGDTSPEEARDDR